MYVSVHAYQCFNSYIIFMYVSRATILFGVISILFLALSTPQGLNKPGVSGDDMDAFCDALAEQAKLSVALMHALYI